MKLKDELKLLYVKILNLISLIKRVPGEFRYNSNGIHKDEEDSRDYKVEVKEGVELPKVYMLPIDASKYIKNQGKFGSCFSHALCTSIEIMHDILKTKYRLPLSERFHYYYTRKLYQKNFPAYGGMTARNGLKCAQQIGICPEKLCPYIASKMNEEPDKIAQGFAHFWKIDSYYRIASVEGVKQVLLNNNPLLLGIYMNKSFKDFKGPIEIVDGEKTYGGHEIAVAVGYSDLMNAFCCINSWGHTYKEDGLMWLPYEYVNKYGIDIWTFNVKK